MIFLKTLLVFSIYYLQSHVWIFLIQNVVNVLTQKSSWKIFSSNNSWVF